MKILTLDGRFLSRVTDDQLNPMLSSLLEVAAYYGWTVRVKH